MPSLLRQCRCEVFAALDVGTLELQALSSDVFGIGELIACQMNGCEIRQIDRLSRLQFKCFLDESCRVGESVLLQRDDARQMPRIRVLRVFLQDRCIPASGSGDVTVSMPRNGGMQLFVDPRRGHDSSLNSTASFPSDNRSHPKMVPVRYRRSSLSISPISSEGRVFPKAEVAIHCTSESLPQSPSGSPSVVHWISNGSNVAQ